MHITNHNATGRLVTPFFGALVKVDPVNWNDMTYNSVSGTINTVQVKRITGINRRIIVRVRSGNLNLIFIYWHVAPDAYWPNGVAQTVTDLTTAAANGIGSHVTQDLQTTPLLIGVNPGDYLTFAAYNTSNSSAITLTVENTSDGDTSIDTFGSAYDIV